MGFRPLLGDRARWRWSCSLGSGCGSSDGGDYGGQHPDYAKALAGSPPPLAALHNQANELLPGGTDAYEKRIAALRGYPVVVNVWASWCGPCRFEFPTLQQLSARYGKRVAFLGVNSEDSDDAADTFLAEAPVPYPSYTDPDKDIVDSLGAGCGLPDTAFYDRDGRARLPQAGPVHRRRRTAKPTSSATPLAKERIIEAMEAFVVIALVGVGLLLAELLLPTGGVLAALGALGLIAGGVVALDSDSDVADYVGPALITLGLLSGVTFYFVTRKVLEAHRDAAGAHRHRGAGRRRRPRRAPRSTPRARSGSRARSGARGWPTAAAPVAAGG